MNRNAWTIFGLGLAGALASTGCATTGGPAGLDQFSSDVPGAVAAPLQAAIGEVAETAAKPVDLGAPIRIDWRNLRNPIYEFPGWSTKDACLIERGGTFYLFFSAFFWNDGRIRSHVSAVKTTDLKTFSEPLFIWDGRDEGWTGMCSPNITEVDGVYYLTYNSWGDDHPNGSPNQLFYAKSTDLENWEKHKPIARDITVNEQGEPRRAIDIAIARAGDFWVLSWKANQAPQVATAPTLDGPWTLLGQPAERWFENAQFLKIDNRWRMLVTGLDEESGDLVPFLLTMASGDGTRPEDFGAFDGWQRLTVPVESFNTSNSSNAAFLLDRRAIDGYYYLLYAGTTQDRSHAGRGDNRLGLARSRDLVKWVAPGDTSNR